MTQSPVVDEEVLPEDTPIWRYMDLARFVVLLSERKLRFTKATQLHAGDPYEAYGEATGLPSTLVPGAHPVDQGLRMMFAYASHLAAEAVKEAPHRLYISSWCWGPESLGMWMLYGAGGYGVAIRSTIGQFMTSLERPLTPDHYRFGPVRYHGSPASFSEAMHNFTQGSIPASGELNRTVLGLAFNKRTAYAYEQEWRAAIVQDPRPDVCGLDEMVNLSTLISAVFVGPKATPLEMKAVAAVMGSAGLGVEITKSTLLSPPQTSAPVG